MTQDTEPAVVGQAAELHPDNPLMEVVSAFHDAPLAARDRWIPFDRIGPEHVGPALHEVLTQARADVEALASGGGNTFADVIGELDRLTRRVAVAWSPVTHLNNVRSDDAFREAFGAVLPEMTQFWSRLLNHDGLYQRIRTYADQASDLSPLEERHLGKVLDEFVRAGAELPEAGKARLEEIRIRLSQLSQTFQENLLKETAAFSLNIPDERHVRGLPESTLETARKRAEEAGEDGWTFGLDIPTVQSVLKLAEHRPLRYAIHQAYLDRCTDGDHDNRPLIEEILSLRAEMSDLLGYSDFPDYRLEDFMAKSGSRVRAFLDDLIAGTEPYFRRDLGLLEEEAGRKGLVPLEPWDVSFLIEGMRQERFDLEEEALRPWFPLPEVKAGLFEITRRVFGFSIKEVEVVGAWHPDVQAWEVRDEDDTHLATFYSDWFPREEKRQGAWMDCFVTGGPRPGGKFAPHVAFIGGNFTPPTGDKPALLTHREVQTLFHEFGHLLHQASSRVEIPGRSGINVAWDWVEVPSQLMENWTWERKALDVFARHWETGEALGIEALDRMLAARRFMAGWQQTRQLSFANLDLELHRTYAQGASGDTDVMEFAKNTLRPFVPSDRFTERNLLPSFSHLFAGGYASAYYSYLWSETLEADIFSRFAEEGVMNAEVGRAFVDRILSQGDKDDPEALFQHFMGRDLDPSALLRRNLGPPPSGDS